MATKESIAIREQVARQAIQAAIRDIGGELGIALTPQPLELSHDPAYRAMNELEQLADLLEQVWAAMKPLTDADAEESLEDTLEALTVKQLQDLAEARAITVDAKARKAEIIAALLAPSDEAPSASDREAGDA